jgi:hypothetical protein
MGRRIQLFTKAERIAIAADRKLPSLPRLAFMERRATASGLGRPDLTAQASIWAVQKE